MPIYQIKSVNGGSKIRTVYQNLLVKWNDLPVETKSSYPALSTINPKPKKLTVTKISTYSSCSDTDSEFEYILVKRKSLQQYISRNFKRRGEDRKHEIISNKPESESDTSEAIKQNYRRPKQNLIPLENHHTITHKFFIVYNKISVT